MTTNRVSPERGFCNPKALPKGPGGRNLCRQCSQECPRGRRTFCGDPCVDAWKIKTDPGHVRRLLWSRDQGQCALCPAVCTHSSISSRDWETQRVIKAIPWEADHIVPVIEGGGECGLENYRTLCRPCHVRVTAELRARLAARRREAKHPSLPLEAKS